MRDVRRRLPAPGEEAALLREPASGRRVLRTERIDADLVVVGGGMAGVCCAITAARAGVRVALVQDRPVPGGNASSEVRLWIQGATCHGNSNNRWAREGGVLDEILVENTYRNPEGNPVLFDAVLLEKLSEEPGIRLLLNTAAFALETGPGGEVTLVRAFCSQNSTLYELRAPLFCDASGDGIVGYLAGAAFRMGAEPEEEFGEKFAPSPEYGELLGHSIYFYSKDAGRPVRFVPPSFALKDITKIPRFRSFNSQTYGCRLWWIEYGGRLDTVHDTEAIKWELWKVVYGVWDYIKNSGNFPDAENLTLEWVGLIPGKRESRRFEGPYMLRQQDIVEQREHPDAVSYGGWSIDLHPANGVYSELPGCTQWHSRGVYQIPYRCLFSRNVPNLFLAGRIISASHVAFGSTRVMATCAHSAQAAGMAAALCTRDGLKPADLLETHRMRDLQRELMRAGQYIPGMRLEDPDDLARSATLRASSELVLRGLPADGDTLPLDRPAALLVPVPAGPVPEFTFTVDADEDTSARVELRTSLKPGNHSPDVILESVSVPVDAGKGRPVRVRFDTALGEARYVFVAFAANRVLALHLSGQRLTGLLTVRPRALQAPQQDIGVETFEIWRPDPRPGGKLPAFRAEPGIAVFGASNVVNGVARPTTGPNAWLPDLDDGDPWLEMRWDEEQEIRQIDLSFDTDFEHAMATVLVGHPERAMPFCVKELTVTDGDGRTVAGIRDNHQTRRRIVLSRPVRTKLLRLEALRANGDCPPAVFEVRCYRQPVTRIVGDRERRESDARGGALE